MYVPYNARCYNRINVLQPYGHHGLFLDATHHGVNHNRAHSSLLVELQLLDVTSRVEEDGIQHACVPESRRGNGANEIQLTSGCTNRGNGKHYV